MNDQNNSLNAIDRKNHCNNLTAIFDIRDGMMDTWGQHQGVQRLRPRTRTCAKVKLKTL